MNFKAEAQAGESDFFSLLLKKGVDNLKSVV